MDRLLLQLKLAGALSQLAGFVFGRCTNCTASDPSESFTVEQVVEQYVAPLGVPAFSGAMFGHDLVDGQYTLPIGVMAEIDADAGTELSRSLSPWALFLYPSLGTITLLEAGVL